jgi:hypothetical protein
MPVALPLIFFSGKVTYWSKSTVFIPKRFSDSPAKRLLLSLFNPIMQKQPSGWS